MAMITTNVRLRGCNHPRGFPGFNIFVVSMIGGLLLSLLAGCGTTRSPGTSSGTSHIRVAKPATVEQRQTFAEAEALSRAGRDAEALEAFKNFVQRYPSSSLTDQALMTLGALSFKSGQLHQAQGYYQHLTQHFPTSPLAPEAHLKLGIASHDLHDYNASMSSLSQALAGLTLTPQQAQAHYYIGLNLRQLQRYMEAFEAFQRAAQLSPDTALQQESQHAMDTLIERDMTPDDLQQLANRYATNANPQGAQLLLRLAHHYRDTRDTTGEMAVLQQLVNTYPNHPELSTFMTRLEALQSAQLIDKSKIGVLLPLSGEGQLAGQRVLWGIEVALESLRAEQPGLDIKLEVRDSQGDSAVAAKALRSLVTDHHVIAVIGPLFSQVATESGTPHR